MAEKRDRRSTRIAAFTGAFLLFSGTVALWFSSGQTRASTDTRIEAASAALDAEPDASANYTEKPAPLLDAPPPPRPLSREEKRFARQDRNDDGRIQQAEYLSTRRRNFDKLDTNGDGRVSFEEYAAEGIKKFAAADADGNGALSPGEFATTAPPPRKSSATASRQCPPCALAAKTEKTHSTPQG